MAIRQISPQNLRQTIPKTTGIVDGEKRLVKLASDPRRKTIAGYIEERIRSPYQSPKAGADYMVNVHKINAEVPKNLWLIVGDESLEMQASRVSRATNPGPNDAWRLVHGWIRDLIADCRQRWNGNGPDLAVFIDCNPSFSIYTELAVSASDNVIIPFSADGSSKRAVRAVLALLYGRTRVPGAEQSEFYLNTQTFGMAVPKIYGYVGNRLTQMDDNPANAFKTVVAEIGKETWDVWQSNPGIFAIHPAGAPSPRTRAEFQRMFQVEINDANTASVVSSGLGIPITNLTAGRKYLIHRNVTVNQSQLSKQQPNIRKFVKSID